MDPVSLIIGITMNLYTLNNIDFFHQRANNNNTMTCHWRYVGKQKPMKDTKKITLFGNIYYRQVCKERAK